MSSITKTIYQYDPEGFYERDALFQVLEGVYLPDNCTETALPEADAAENFFKWDGEKWNVVPKPKSAAELVGVTVSHDSKTPHDLEIKDLMVSLCGGDSGYRVKRGADLSWSVEKVPDPTIEELKAAKKLELNSAFDQWYTDGAVVTSSLGFVADSDERAVTDVSGLIKVAEAAAGSSEEVAKESAATTVFMDANNQPHLLTIEELQTLQLEIIQNGQDAYTQKWTIRAAIDAAESKEALDKIEIKFVALDFSKEAAAL